jgi:hypothetical protein
MQGSVIFIACEMTATFVILAALYAICRDTKPNRPVAAYRRVRFHNFRLELRSIAGLGVTNGSVALSNVRFRGQSGHDLGVM